MKKGTKKQTSGNDKKREILEQAKKLLTDHEITFVGIAYLDTAEELVLIRARPAHIYSTIPIITQLGHQLAQTPPTVN